MCYFCLKLLLSLGNLNACKQTSLVSSLRSNRQKGINVKEFACQGAVVSHLTPYLIVNCKNQQMHYLLNANCAQQAQHEYEQGCRSSKEWRLECSTDTASSSSRSAFTQSITC